MEVLDFLSIRSHQSFEDKAEINPTEIKIENDKIFLFEKYKKTALGLDLKICCFQFLMTIGINNTKYSLVNSILY